MDPAERYKGHEEVFAVLPAVARQVPDVAYLVVGGGADRARLEALVRACGLAERVVFAGHVPEHEKLAHYRLADVFAMPGRGEGFGIAFLEAMACGVPVVASAADASREAVRDGALGAVVDPADPDALVRALLDALGRGPGAPPEGLAYFGADRFRARWHALLAGRPGEGDAGPAVPEAEAAYA
jgi:glycosyltransferase involved in cell wall biosynthesis